MAVVRSLKENRNFIQFHRETDDGEYTKESIFLNVSSILEIREESEEA
ncbi:TPA: hypothetical protein L2866_002851 [Listeria innocua]|nr:hypothetical protein [Listeria innocua]HBN5051449.1 hypothetical protein [Listeria innocua]